MNKLFLPVIIILLWGGTQSSLSFSQPDSLDVRYFSEDSLSQYRDDPAFDYTIEQIELSYLDRFLNWFQKNILSPILPGLPGWIYNTLFFVLVVGGFIILFLTTMRNKGGGIIQSSGREVSESIYDEVNINELDFSKEISEAEQNKTFRIAVRMHFLKTMKQLSDKKLIEITPGKTNREYIGELSGKNFSGDFNRLVRFYEFIWYGDFPLDENTYTMIKSNFINFHEGV